MLGKTYSTPEWAELQLNFMLAHKYLSDAGKDRYQKDLKKNIDDQRDYLKKKEKKAKKKDQGAERNLCRAQARHRNHVPHHVLATT